MLTQAQNSVVRCACRQIRFQMVLAAMTNLLLQLATAGTWVPLTHSPPAAAGHFLLLSDGTVMAENLSTNYGPGWFRLTPDIHGRYANGTWSTLAPMHYTRLDFASDVLTNGKVFFAGGEYGNGTNTAEIYDPVANSWSIVSIPGGIITGAGFVDSDSVLLSNGKVLITPVDPATYGGTAIYDPVANHWSTALLKTGSDEDEASSVKLPDDSILLVDGGGTTSERYIPSLNQWVADANVPVRLYDTAGGEEGPGLLLPNGKAMFFGGTTNTAIYTPSGTTSPGSWVAGPAFPNGQGMPDAPAAMLVNGKVLCAVARASTNATEWAPPVSFYEYDYVANSFTRVSAPGGGTTFNDVSWPTLMLDLPDGTVLFGHRNTDFYVYQPDGIPLAAGTPVINSCTTNLDGSLHLAGTGFNGLSQGAAYGDDEQMDSNFPLVRFTDGSGTVRYGRTYNWSRSSVMTGNAVVSTDCTLPPGASLQDLIQVVANGIASMGTGSVVISTNDNGAGSLRQIVASAPAGSRITFSTNLSGKMITLTNGEIALNNHLTIDGSALANPIQLNGNNRSRIFNVGGGASVTLTALVLTNAFTSGGNWGGAIANGGTLAISNCTCAGNSVDASGNGGAIASSGPLTLSGCTFYGNAAGFSGALDNRATCTAMNCTFYGNTAVAGNGGAIDNPFSATLSLLNCTFYGNSASGTGGDIDNYLSLVNLTNTILAASTPDDLYNWAGSTNTAGGSNLVQALDNAGTLFGTNTILTVNPLLGPLANNGGPTLTLMPQIGSPAIDAGVSSAAAGLTFDQRGAGFPRQVGDAVDLGAVEASIVPYVFNNSDSGYGSLRYAVTYAANNSTITFSNTLSGQTILLTSGEILLTNNLAIDASALANGVNLSGNQASRVFEIAVGKTGWLTALAIANGNSGNHNGGGIYNSGTLTISNCTLVSNVSSNAGGGAANLGTMTISKCTFAGNTSASLFWSGGGIENAGTLVVNESTLTGNAANGGGGIFTESGSLLAVNQSTVVSNTAYCCGGGISVYATSGNQTLVNSIVAGNSAGNPALGDLYLPGSFTTSNADLTAVNPQLAPLGNYGGPTMTMPPLPGSPAVDTGNDTAANAFATDQRGLPRKSGEHVDIGAAELQLITANTPPHIASAKQLGNSALQLNFTNQSGASFRLLTATNVSLPLEAWTEIGFATETPANSGQFQFTDPQATNFTTRFYRVKSP